ncbi:MAG: glycosyltransferase family 2 protein, partial [Ignavibacteriaceae bacterium]|nr:glycosyltransferase family 2 protein [Ignavibacteriaceae bacterium]
MKTNISFIVLTFNEEKHIERCIKSLKKVSDNIFIVDSFSKDNTVEIVNDLGVNLYQNKWVNYSEQFNWAMNNCRINSEWVMRIDADEYLSDELCNELINTLPNLFPPINGLTLNYRHYFWGRWIKHGTRYPLTLLRIWRRGYGIIEKKWMDERIILTEGEIYMLKNDFIHDDLNNLSYFTEKHNSYATREAIDLLNKKYKFLDENPAHTIENKSKRHFNLWVKDTLYAKPFFVWIRSFIYFFYRYICRLGFLDGKEGLA